MKLITICLIALAFGCGPLRRNNNSYSPPPTATQPPVVSGPTNVYTIKVYSGDNQSGPIGQQLQDPLVVEVRDSNGNPADWIYVMYEADIFQDGPWGLGSATTGTGQYLVAMPGTGRAVGLALPRIQGPAKVRVHVIPTVIGQGTGPFVTSNDCFFTVYGQ